MTNNNLSLNLALEALQYIKNNHPNYIDSKDDIIKAQLFLVDIRDNCKVVKNLPIMLDNR